MIRLARLSIRRPRAALAFWAIFAVVLSLIGLGVSDSLSPSISVVPGSESSRAQTLSQSEFGPSVLVPILLEGPAAQLDRQGPKLVVALSKRGDTRVMSAWSTGASGRALRPRPDAAMIVASVAKTEKQMVETVQPQIDRTVDSVLTGQVKAHITGQATLDRALKDEAISTTRQAELIAVGLLFVLLLIGLRTPVAAFVLAGFGAVTTLTGFGAMALLGQVIETDPLAVALASITGLALGVGYSLMIVDRFREEGMAAAGVVTTAGRAVLLSGTALIIALILATAIAPTPILTSIGIGVLLCSALATGAAVVVMPAVLTLLGSRIDAFSFPAPRFLERGWDWLVGRGRWVTRWAVPAGAIATAALVALALPVGGLKTGPPDVTMLPASTLARQSFERVSAVMGPGWPTPFGIVVVSTKKPITAPSLLAQVQTYQRSLARDKRVDSVVGPGAFVSQSKDLKALPKGLKSSAKLLKGGKKDLGRLEKGLGQAGDGASQLRSGLASAADGAGQLQAGSGTAGSGAGKLHAGLGQARAGALKISAGLHDALVGATALKKGSAAALAGSEKLAGGLGKAAKPVNDGLPVFKQLAGDVNTASSVVTATTGAAQSSTGQIDAALSQLRSMTTGKGDPRYAQALSALSGGPHVRGRRPGVARGCPAQARWSRRRLDDRGQAGGRPVRRAEPALRRLDRSAGRHREAPQGQRRPRRRHRQAQHAAAASSPPASAPSTTARPRSNPGSASSPRERARCGPACPAASPRVGSSSAGSASSRPASRSSVARCRRRRTSSSSSVSRRGSSTPGTSCSRPSRAPRRPTRIWPRSRSTSIAAATPARSWSSRGRPPTQRPRGSSETTSRRRPPRSRRPAAPRSPSVARPAT